MGRERSPSWDYSLLLYLFFSFHFFNFGVQLQLQIYLLVCGVGATGRETLICLFCGSQCVRLYGGWVGACVPACLRVYGWACVCANVDGSVGGEV